MRGITQISLVLASIILLFGFLQTRDENDRRADLIAQFERLCIPLQPGDRAVAEWKDGKLTCITFQSPGYGIAPRIVRADQLAWSPSAEKPLYRFPTTTEKESQ